MILELVWTMKAISSDTRSCSQLCGLHSAVCRALHRHRRESWGRIPLEPREFFRFYEREFFSLLKIVQRGVRIISLFLL